MHGKRVDSNHSEIRSALRKAGFIVYDTSKFGEGFPDLVVVLKNGRAAILTEIKPEGGGQIKPDEVTFMLKLVEPAYRIVMSSQQAIDVLREAG